MHQVQRHQAILNAVAEHRIVTMTGLAAALGVSEATIRRDIREMSDNKLLRKVHGGAEAIEQNNPASLSTQPFANAMAINAEQKRAIAGAAAQMCRDDESIMIGGGTTTQKMAEYLLNRRMTVLTNSLVVAIPLIQRGRGRVILAGGEAYREHNVILSPFDHDNFENHRVSKLFLGAMSVGQCGVMEGDPRLVRVGQRMIDQAEEIILLVDSSKFRRQDGMILCPLERISRIVTDPGVGKQTLEMFALAGVPVTVAPSVSAALVY